MSLGMSFAWRSTQPKQKYCQRCELYYDETLEKCSHCSELTDSEVITLKEKQEDSLQSNSHLGKYFLLATIILAGLLFLSFL
ncbi:MAG: recombinational DNA repair protein RecR [Psychromonas sp.]|jgi:recombinational DNA repair protein RecR|uniref:hypothetical protein n=1 Tax=Psychromonas sp. TaxID=1884585 RepID=UPI0039E25A65